MRVFDTGSVIALFVYPNQPPLRDPNGEGGFAGPGSRFSCETFRMADQSASAASDLFPFEPTIDRSAEGLSFARALFSQAARPLVQRFRCRPFFDAMQDRIEVPDGAGRARDASQQPGCLHKLLRIEDRFDKGQDRQAPSSGDSQAVNGARIAPLGLSRPLQRPLDFVQRRFSPLNGDVDGWPWVGWVGWGLKLSRFQGAESLVAWESKVVGRSAKPSRSTLRQETCGHRFSPDAVSKTGVFGILLSSANADDAPFPNLTLTIPSRLSKSNSQWRASVHRAGRFGP